MNFTLSYNSQIWQQSGGTTSLLGRDLGFGLGWTLQAGSLLQVLNSYYIFTDSTGAQYKLDQNSNGVWTSRDSVYIAYDSAYHRLFFPDGTFWMMTVQSGTSEADAGTLLRSILRCGPLRYSNLAHLRYWHAGVSSATRAILRGHERRRREVDGVNGMEAQRGDW